MGRTVFGGVWMSRFMLKIGWGLYRVLRGQGKRTLYDGLCGNAILLRLYVGLYKYVKSDTIKHVSTCLSVQHSILILTLHMWVHPQWTEP